MQFSDGIAAQPAVLARSCAAVSAAVADLPRPRAGDVIALVGIGASEHVARTTAYQWRADGLRAFAVSAAEMADGGATADLYVAISESGRSTETLRAVELVGGSPTVAVVNAPDSPLARGCSAVLHLDSGPDSPIYTTGYTATLQALGLLGEHWSGRRRDWSALPGLTARVLEDAGRVIGQVRDGFDRARVVDVVASGGGGASGGEGALLLRESARLLTAAHETRNYLHGPMEPLDPEVACLVIGAGRELTLARDVAALGCATLLVTTAPGAPSPFGLRVLRVPAAHSAVAQAVLDILPVQRLAEAVAGKRGLAVCGFRYPQDDTKDGAHGG